jgi:hypothetical protein
MKMVDAALDYANRGLSVFPCAQKIPLTGPGGFKNATTDVEEIRAWWGKHPAAQIGLPTGQINHLIVIDIDGPQGVATVAKMNLSSTRTIETRPGRQQLWFRLQDGIKTKCTVGVLGEQIDTRADGGYIVVPPSIHHITGKPYRVLKDVPLADAPAVLMEPKKVQSSRAVDEIQTGQRHHTLLSIAGALRARGVVQSLVLETLRTINLRCCRAPLEDSELQELAAYVGAKDPGVLGSPGALGASALVEIECFDKVTPERVRWVWEKRVPLGKFGLFVGEPGKGKSLGTIKLAGHISRGQRFPDGAECEIGDVIFLSAEDDPADTQLPRLIAAGANLSRIHRVKAVKVAIGHGATGESPFNLERDIEKLDEALSKIPNARLLVIDPVNAYMGKTDTHRDADVRRVLAPLSELAARRRIGTIGVMHLKKTRPTHYSVLAALSLSWPPRESSGVLGITPKSQTRASWCL